MQKSEKLDTDIEELKNFVVTNNSQGHVCILNNNLFLNSIQNGIYGFPHAGAVDTKSYWRAIASLYNIGSSDLIFFHRTYNKHEGCKEVHGPFGIWCINGEPSIFYDGTNSYPIYVEKKLCTARFLFKPLRNEYRSIFDNYELIKMFETKQIWGLRHPSVMNIGFAQKKSIAALTVNQTLKLVDLLYDPRCGKTRGILKKDAIPPSNILTYHNGILKNPTQISFHLNDSYLENVVYKYGTSIPDEAVLYCYILRGLKFAGSNLRSTLIKDLDVVNDKLLSSSKVTFEDLSVNAVLELVISPHLQETVDIMLCDKEENNLLLMEIKKERITQEAINQMAKYIDLFETIFPRKNIIANIVGEERETKLAIPSRFRDQIALVEYYVKDGRIRFT